ncbi:DNA/RNA helicase domain-containing protein [Jatrophihabitans sp.]|uniref:DNA/RNA helicase domain-containing protein n=1 Tax=Jatrophihabitans sp. TaxID=1932789 RepID=UPI0038CD35E5
MTLRYSADVFARVAATDSVVERLFEQILYQAGHRASPAEMRSWQRSLPVLAQDLLDAGLGNVEVIVEYQLPLTSQRADVVLAGVHPVTGRSSYVVVELKQWSSARRWEADPNLVEVDGQPGGPKNHPVRQVRNYCTHVIDFARTLHGDEDAVAGVAYLHNAVDPQAVSELFDFRPDLHGQLFTGADRGKFHDFLRSRLDPTVPGAAYADELLRSAVAPSRQLLAVAAEEVQHREQFKLQGNQQLAVDLVMHEVARAQRADSKAVIIVSGGPGSGKSVIALSLLGELARQGRTVLHATGSRSFTQTLRKVAGNRAPRVQKMFKYFNQFMDAERNGLDVLILDEAHRIRETSVNRYTTAQYRTGRPQLDELMSAARVPVFLLDENQVVRPGEMGAVESIRAYAKAQGLRVHHVPLPEQFRCGGSASYIRWVERMLGLTAEGPGVWHNNERFEVRVAESPLELEQLLLTKEADGYTARMSAGYCWPWSDPRPDGTLVPDVAIGDWARPWNLKGDRRVGTAPPAALWASDPGGIGQVGCVYTAQGFEYDWNGVIIGDDLLWRNGSFVSNRSANRDPDFRSAKTVGDQQFDGLVRNVYKVLFTRGMVGTVIYSTDAQTRDALRRLVY